MTVTGGRDGRVAGLVTARDPLARGGRRDEIDLRAVRARRAVGNGPRVGRVRLRLPVGLTPATAPGLLFGRRRCNLNGGRSGPEQPEEVTRATERPAGRHRQDCRDDRCDSPHARTPWNGILGGTFPRVLSHRLHTAPNKRKNCYYRQTANRLDFRLGRAVTIGLIQARPESVTACLPDCLHDPCHRPCAMADSGKCLSSVTRLATCGNSFSLRCVGRDGSLKVAVRTRRPSESDPGSRRHDPLSASRRSRRADAPAPRHLRLRRRAAPVPGPPGRRTRSGTDGFARTELGRQLLRGSTGRPDWAPLPGPHSPRLILPDRLPGDGPGRVRKHPRDNSPRSGRRVGRRPRSAVDCSSPGPDASGRGRFAAAVPRPLRPAHLAPPCRSRRPATV